MDSRSLHATLAPLFNFLIVIFVNLATLLSLSLSALSPFLFAEPFEGRMQAYDFHPKYFHMHFLKLRIIYYICHTIITFKKVNNNSGTSPNVKSMF